MWYVKVGGKWVRYSGWSENPLPIDSLEGLIATLTYLKNQGIKFPLITTNHC